MTDKSLNTMLMVLIVAILLAGSWLLGKRQGEIDAAALASRALSSAEAQDIIFSLQAELREKEAELINANHYTQAVDTRTLTLQSQLDTLLKERQADALELSLYRRIESNQKERAIVVESLRLNAKEPETLELTLLSWQGRDRVSGDLQLTLNYSQSVPGATMQSTETYTEESSWIVELKPVKFNFRFFQTFKFAMQSSIGEVNAGNSDVPAPDSVDIEINASNRRLKTPDRRILWSEIAE